MSGKFMRKPKRDQWLQKEVDTLLDQAIIYKEILDGKHAHNVSQIDKQNMWKQITIIIHQEHPECPEKTVDIVKKKWQNFTAAARTAIRIYNAGLTETGGGPLGNHGVLSPMYYKYYEQVLGLDNPSVAATAIPGSVSTDDPILSDKTNQFLIMEHILGRPSNNKAYFNDDEGDENPHQDDTINFAECALTNTNDEQGTDYFSTSDNESRPNDISLIRTPTPGQLAIENGLNPEHQSAALTSKNTAADKGKSLVKKSHVVVKRSNSTPIPSISADISKTVSLKSISVDSSVDSVSPSPTSVCLSFKQKRASLTLRQTVKKAKFSVCNLADLAAKSRLTDARLRVLKSIMTVREMLNEPLEKTEIPPDLLNLLYNVEDNI